MLLGPKSIQRPARAASGSGGLKKSTSSAAAAAAASGRQASSPAALRQASQCSLLAAGKSTVASVNSAQAKLGSDNTFGGSRSSITSDCTSVLSVGSCQSAKSRRSTTAGNCVTAGSKTTTRVLLTNQKLSSSQDSKSSASSTSSGASSSSSIRAKVPGLAMALRDKDQQIKLLIKERDEHKFQAELMKRKADEWQDKFHQSEVERSHVTSEADDEVVELRRLAQELEDENRRLADKVATSEQVASDSQFKLDELECERAELRRELEERELALEALERERAEVESGGKSQQQVVSERMQSKQKYERDIELLKQQILGRDEQMMQLRSSLEMRKQELGNLQTRAADLERKLKIESERSERHLKRIDEINLELKATEAKLATKQEETEVQERQMRQLRQELRLAEDKLEQVSLARKKDVDVLHGKLAAARRGSTTPTGCGSPAGGQQPASNSYKTPTPQDEIVRLQMEIRDLKDQLIDREAELDCNRRDMDVLRRKMETRTLEVDCNNQELARRCQDLLEQNRQSEETVKQLLKSTTEHSAQLVRATDDLKEANGKCIKLRDEINELEAKLDEQVKRCTCLGKQNGQLRDENEEQREQIDALRQQVDSLNEQLTELCEQLDVQTSSLHKDREALANQLSQNEMDSAELRHDLATAKQDLRTSRLQTQEMLSERDRLKADLEIKEKYIGSRNDIIEQLRHELDDCKKSLAEQKQKIQELRSANDAERHADEAQEDHRQLVARLTGQLDALKRECRERQHQSEALSQRCDQLQGQLDEMKQQQQQQSEPADELAKFDEMRQKHSAELDKLKLTIANLELQLEEARAATLKRAHEPVAGAGAGGRRAASDYETQIEFLNSVVVDMQRKCDDYKTKLAQLETKNIMHEFDNLLMASQVSSRASTMRRNGDAKQSSATNNNTNQVPTIEQPARRISGRPYCDICRVYDLHHTVHCPKVSEKLAEKSRQQTAADNNNYLGPTIVDNNNGSASIINTSTVDELFREYEQSLQVEARQQQQVQFASLRRPPDGKLANQPRPYCDHCDLFGHTIKSCNSLKV